MNTKQIFRHFIADISTLNTCNSTQQFIVLCLYVVSILLIFMIYQFCDFYICEQFMSTLRINYTYQFHLQSEIIYCLLRRRFRNYKYYEILNIVKLLKAWYTVVRALKQQIFIANAFSNTRKSYLHT